MAEQNAPNMYDSATQGFYRATAERQMYRSENGQRSAVHKLEKSSKKRCYCVFMIRGKQHSSGKHHTAAATGTKGR